MGQLWEMIAHERRETLGGWGKAGEFVPSSYPNRIIHRLAVPVAISDYKKTRYKPTAPFWAKSSDQVDAGPKSAAAHQAPQNHGLLLQLPTEIVLLITEPLDLNSLYTLTRCCHALRNLLSLEVDNRFRRTLAPWANTPLMCAGEYIRSNPPGIITHLPLDVIPFVTRPLPAATAVTAYHVMQLMSPTNVIDSSRTCLYPPTLISRVNPIQLSPVEPMHWFQHRGTSRYLPWRRVLEIKKYFPYGQHWVLRNLTTMEYVFARVLSSKDGQGGGLDRPDAAHEWGFTLGTVVAVNTCWSDDSSAAMFGLDVRGKWAGHRFDIVTEKKLLQDMKAGGGTWVDVSHREWAAMVRLFEENRWNEDLGERRYEGGARPEHF
ncbi:hypothetical protein L211DRAFT_882343 [Terfezia boudieri ATCC MYA-4762]|uniref:F-box domain-containing protein n=1 Tax=Terfezia boudieri ATCC MYA-4762 TaxID=1051890 RepID=A0A3N4LZB9_9PEZI|nr:hypothetical protein L211DRAFT_882343 [Terfezia boudieri ATCC MYA-4762]